MLLPLDHYTISCLKPPTPDNPTNCRLGYGRPVVKHWEPICAYCGKDLGESYDSWLDLSVDHVVPQKAATKWGVTDECKRWLGSLANLVPCCRACNEFLNGFKTGITDQPPNDDSEFLKLRDEMLGGKREKALARHKHEMALYESWHAEYASRKV